MAEATKSTPAKATKKVRYAGPDGDLAHYTPAQLEFHAKNTVCISLSRFKADDWNAAKSRSGKPVTKAQLRKVLAAFGRRENPSKSVRKASASLAATLGDVDPLAPKE